MARLLLVTQTIGDADLLNCCFLSQRLLHLGVVVQGNSHKVILT
jgi:hypothetical protein